MQAEIERQIEQGGEGLDKQDRYLLNQLGGLGECVRREAILLDDFNPSGKRIQTTESGRNEQSGGDTRGEEGVRLYLIKDIFLESEAGVKINTIFNTQERSWMERAPSFPRFRLQRCSGLTPSAYEDTHLV